MSLRIKGVKLSSLGAVYVACSISIHKDLWDSLVEIGKRQSLQQSFVDCRDWETWKDVTCDKQQFGVWCYLGKRHVGGWDYRAHFLLWLSMGQNKRCEHTQAFWGYVFISGCIHHKGCCQKRLSLMSNRIVFPTSWTPIRIAHHLYIACGIVSQCSWSASLLILLPLKAGLVNMKHW